MNDRIAEALVECGYAESTGYDPNYKGDARTTIVTKGYKRVHHVDPFADTLEGRRQADVLEDWLEAEYYELWNKSQDEVSTVNIGQSTQISNHQWRLDRIRWCFQELSDGM